MRLSRRSAWPCEPSDWSRAVARARDAGPLLDLTASNPTAVGLLHPPEVYARLGRDDAAQYRPAPLGLASARAAVADYYARRGREVDPQRIWLCASTSEAYAQLLALLCDPGDAVLVPRPGYPLLDMLGDLAGVRRVGYPLRYDGEWSIDLAGLDAARRSEPRARAVLVIAPHNPTGSLLRPEALAALEARASAWGLPLIVDEVFADYPLGPVRDRVRFVGDLEQPAFVLSGLSKVAALPQLKLSWVVMHGPEDRIAPARRRAELLADAFLSVATPVQLALPALLRAAEAIQPRILERLRDNLCALTRATRGRMVSRLDVDAGWTGLLRLPQLEGIDDLGWAGRLLEAGVLVQPGYLFDLGPPPRVALSLLTPPPRFREGLDRLLERVDTVVSGPSASAAHTR